MFVFGSMFVLVAWTSTVGIAMGIARLQAIRSGAIDPRYFALMSGYEPPNRIVTTTRNFNNLFQVPTLFYAVSILAIVENHISVRFSICAWIYVALRILHSSIHISYNNPRHRMATFTGSCVVLVFMWLDMALLIVF